MSLSKLLSLVGMVLFISPLFLPSPLKAAEARQSSRERMRSTKNTANPRATTTHYLLELTSSFDSRAERSKGGANILYELGARAGILRGENAAGGWTYGGELALRSMTPETEGSNVVKSELYRLSSHAAGLFGYRWSTRHAGFMPHLSLGLSNDFVMVRLVSPGNSTLRPRWLPGLFVGTGVMVDFMAFLLRGDVSYGLSDGRPEYRWNLGLGARF